MAAAPLDIVIPTLNAAAELPDAAETLFPGALTGLVRSLIVSDGGSSDATLAVAEELGATIVNGPPGRGGQIGRGVDAGTAPWVLIVHADTHLPPEWPETVGHHMNAHSNLAGYFDLRFRAGGIAPRLVAAGANLRSRWLQLPYGDQGLLISRDLLSEVGGVPSIPLMEDVVLAQKLRGRLRPLGTTASTSAERYARDGWLKRTSRNLITLARFKLGAKPDDLVKSYNKRN